MNTMIIMLFYMYNSKSFFGFTIVYKPAFRDIINIISTQFLLIQSKYSMQLYTFTSRTFKQNNNKDMLSAKVFFAISALIICSCLFINEEYPSRQYNKQFQQFKTKFDKQYFSQSQEAYRFRIFINNMLKIQRHNNQSENSYQLGVTQFADLTQEQFISIHLNQYSFYQSQVQQQYVKSDINIDWVAEGKVSRVKDQQTCVSFWAFAATSSIQSLYRIKKDENIELSEQQLVDCSKIYGNNGCNGGWMPSALAFAKNQGLKTQEQYPYNSKQGSCSYRLGQYKIKQYFLASGCNNLLSLLINQPIIAAVDASNWSLYRGGILTACGTTINHGVLVVGATDQYWRIKNSWSQSWGERGYIRLKQGNTCGVCSNLSYPTI